jgi:hypothetical protein
MSRCSRSFFFFVIILVGLSAPITCLGDATAVPLRDPLATVDDPDVDPAGPTDHATWLNTDSILPPHSGFGATLVWLRQVPSSVGYGTPQRPALSFRAPRAPPAS